MKGDAAGLPVGAIHRRVWADDRRLAQDRVGVKDCVLAEDGNLAERLEMLPCESLRIDDPVLVALGVATFDRVLFEHGGA